jgi:hypothetical protein
MDIPEVKQPVPGKARNVLIEKLVTPAPEFMIINGVDYR